MTAEALRYLAWVKSSRPASPDGEVLLPGEPERRKRAIRMREGISVPEERVAVDSRDRAWREYPPLEPYGL